MDKSEEAMTLRTTVWIGMALLVAFTSTDAGELKGTVKAVGARHSADAVVYIDVIADKTFPAPTEHVVVDQKNMLFTPRVLPVLVGTTVDFLNSDAVAHNVFSPDKCAEKFNLGSWPTGQSRSYTLSTHAPPPCCATSTRRWRGSSSLCRPLTSR